MEKYFHGQHRRLASAFLGPIHLTVFGRGEWSDADWRDYLKTGVDHGIAHGWAVASITFAGAHAPTAAQRRESKTEVPKEGIAALKRMIVLTDSAVMRMVANSFAMVVRGSNVRAFRPNQCAQALTWLGETVPHDANGLTAALSELLADTGYDPAVLKEQRA